MKDNFSTESDKYAQYRPIYPPELFSFLESKLADKTNAWDCGTGNGQVAKALAPLFEHVYATDISAAQLAQAAQAPNISYSVQPAEHSDFADDFFDLVTVAQAIHWFDFERFYAEVRRTAKADALICVLGYGVLRISPTIDAIIDHFYTAVIGPNWDAERHYIDEQYRTIPFPFEEIECPSFVNRQHWSLRHLIGYLNTWSAVKHFIKANGYNPIATLEQELAAHWPQEESMEVVFPMLLRLGRLSK